MIRLDVAKAGAQLFNLSNLFNARVNDGFTPVKVQWINSTDGNNPLDVKGMKAFLKGQIGQGTIKDDHVELEPKSDLVSWEDDGSGSQPNGITLIKLPPQVFTRDGVFYGYIGLEDADGATITSINIWFNVDQNVMTAGANVPYYLDEIQAALSAVQRSNDTLQRAKQEIDNQISLSKVAFEPEAFENEAALKAKYPAGASGLMVTVDTGHKWLWINGAWKDCGIYQAAGVTAYGLKQSAFTGEPLPSPYDDLNTLPNNTIVSYAPLKSLKNNPLSEAIIVKTEGPTDAATSKNYSKVQTVIGQYSNKKYYRTIWVNDSSTGSWTNWISSAGMEELGFSGEPLPSPYDDLSTLPNNTIVSYAPLKSLKNSPVNEPIIVKTEGPNIVTNKNYTKIQTLIGQWSGKKYYRTIWIGEDGTGSWTDWHSPDGMQQISFSSEPLPSPYDDLNTLPGNKIIFYAPLKSLKNSPVSEPIIVKTEGPNVPTSKDYGEIQTLIGQWSGKKYYRNIWVGDNGTGNWSDWHSESIKQEVNYGNGINQEVSLSIFDKVTVIGDSYSAGWLQKPDGSSFYDKSKYQWARLIGKKYGFTVNNLSMSGWTAQDFVKNKLSDISNNELQDAYIIALGINDQSNGKETLGTKDDLKQDYQNNPDSFYGNMGKIIGTIKGHDVNARIILLTIMRNDGAVTGTFNAAIKDIAKNYSLPVADLDSDPYFQTDEYEQRKAGGHPTIVGYGALAEHLDNVLQKAILNNYDYFCNTASIFDDTVK